MNVEKKLARLEQEIMSQANDECKKINDEYERQKEELFSKRELVLLNDVYNSIQREKKQLEKDKNTRILAVSFENKQNLAKLREQLIDELFSEIEKKVVAFVNSDGYFDYLKRTLESVLYAFPDEKINIIISKNDQKYQEKLKSLNDNISSIELTYDDIIGGLKITGLSSGKVFDNTLRTVFAAERKNFLKNSMVNY